MSRKVIISLVTVAALIGGIALQFFFNANKQENYYVLKEWKPADLTQIFTKNEESFFIVANYIEQNDRDFKINLDTEDVDKIDSIKSAPAEFREALKKLRDMEPNISRISASDSGVEFECKYGVKQSWNFFRYFYEGPSPEESRSLSGLHKIRDSWYLLVAPKT